MALSDLTRIPLAWTNFPPQMEKNDSSNLALLVLYKTKRSLVELVRPEKINRRLDKRFG